jgi:transcriptional regulator with XRE-family HTH domain
VADLVIDRHKLRQVRRALRWTQQDLADRSGVQRSTVSKIESGRRRNLRTSTLQSLARALGVTADELLLSPPQETVSQESSEYRTAYASVVKAAEGLTEDELESVRDYIDFLRTRRKPAEPDLL